MEHFTPPELELMRSAFKAITDTKKTGQHPTREQIQQLFAILDRNEDGKIEKAEFIGFIREGIYPLIQE